MLTVNLSLGGRAKNLDVYSEYFEMPYLESTRMFYEAKSASYLATHGVREYMEWAHSKLMEENDKGERYLENSCSVSKVCTLYIDTQSCPLLNGNVLYIPSITLIGYANISNNNEWATPGFYCMSVSTS